MRYPEDLKDCLVARFHCVDQASKRNQEVTINLPMPNGGLSFSDGGQYNEVDLGIVGQVVKERGANVNSQESVDKTLKELGIKTILLNSAVGSAALRLAEGDKRILAPNTNTNFTSNTMRSFSFAYKLSPRSALESATIKAIDTSFRELVYASSASEKGKIILNFPPTWSVRFIDLADGYASENQSIPKIAACYLTSYNSNFNASGNLYHKDGSPTEVDITLTFQETMVQTREDIIALGKRGQRN
jgi:hypothetical protein